MDSEHPDRSRELFREDYVGLIKGLINQINPAIPDKRMATYVVQLMDPVRFLAGSSLEIIETPGA